MNNRYGGMTLTEINQLVSSAKMNGSLVGPKDQERAAHLTKVPGMAMAVFARLFETHPGGFTAEDVVRASNLSINTAQKYLQAAAVDGLILRVRRGLYSQPATKV